jgi:cell fate (sporulation/competence/biofilm development) regulator YlbF (YheA/YmcA/DUF963 family)
MATLNKEDIKDLREKVEELDSRLSRIEQILAPMLSEKIQSKFFKVWFDDNNS